MERKEWLTSSHFFKPRSWHSPCLMTGGSPHTQGLHTRSRLSALGQGCSASRLVMGVVWILCPSVHSTWQSLWDQQPSLLLQEYDRNHPITAQKRTAVKNRSAGAHISASRRSRSLPSLSRAPWEFPRGVWTGSPEKTLNTEHIPRTGTTNQSQLSSWHKMIYKPSWQGHIQDLF